MLVDFCGEGKAEFFVNGKQDTGSWIKSWDTAITKFFSSIGEEVELLPGNTWDKVVSDRVKISVQ